MERLNKRSYNNRAYYNYTSEAYNYDLYSEPVFKRKKAIKKKKIKYVVAEKNIKWLSLNFILTLGIISAFAFTSLGVQAAIIQKKFSIDKLNDELKAINEDNSYLRTELSKNLDLEEVEKLAINKIGMQKPTSNQIFYIDVPKESYTVKNDVSSDKKYNILSKFDIKKLFKN